MKEKNLPACRPTTFVLDVKTQAQYLYVIKWNEGRGRESIIYSYNFSYSTVTFWLGASFQMQFLASAALSLDCAHVSPHRGCLPLMFSLMEQDIPNARPDPKPLDDQAA